MENRQKNYGSVHDTKASMMYNRFLKQYNDWLSGGPIPDTGNQDTKYFLGQQRKRLEKRGLHRDSSIELRGLLASAGAIPPKVGKKYTNVTEFRTAQRNTTYSRGGRIIGKFRKKEILYQTITFANEATVDGTEPCTCPSCGAVSQIKALFEGCPYCHTRFLMQDLYPKVANFYSIEDLSYSKEEIKRTLTPWCGGGAVIFTVFMLAYLAWERAKTSDPLTLYSMICPLIGCPVIGAFGGYMLFALKTLGYIFLRAMQSLGLLFATSGSKNRLIRFMKNYEPDFGYENFANQVIALAKNIIFSEPGEDLSIIRGPWDGESFQNITDIVYRGAMSVGNCWQEGPYVYADIDLYFCDTYDRGSSMKEKNDRIRMIVGKNIQIPQDPGYSIHQVSCESCGASFDAMKLRHCPYCKREYDMRDHAWTVMKIRKTGGKTS